jgi:hypothetical protein
MPDEILEMIYSDLSLYESVQTNIALCKKIRCSSVYSLKYDEDLFDVIPSYYHKYIIINYNLSQSKINTGKYDKIYGIRCEIDVTNLSRLSNIKWLKMKSNIHKTKDILSSFDSKNLIYLNCNKCDIGDISSLVNLTTLSCNLSNVKDVNNLVNLTELECDMTEITDISKLVNLEKLSCINDKIKDLSNLRKLKNLRCGPEIENISHLTNLIELNIGGNLKIKSMDSLISLVNLQKLICDHTDISYLSGLPKLDTIYCQRSKVEYISDMPILEYISCENSNIKKITNVPNLISLVCYNTEIMEVNHLLNLELLNCNDTNITNVDLLINLLILDCSKSKITNISTLIKLSNLSCDDTLISDISNNTELESLHYMNSEIILTDDQRNKLYWCYP